MNAQELLNDVKFYIDDLTLYQKLAWGAVALGIILILAGIMMLQA